VRSTRKDSFDAHRIFGSGENMSQARIEQFYGKAVKDPALVNRMLMGTKSPDDFVRNAVKEGKSQGFDFSYE
jgi:Nif11 domain